MLDCGRSREIRRIGVIGFGAIGRIVIDAIMTGDLVTPVPQCVVLVRQKHRERLNAEYGGRVQFVENIQEITQIAPHVVIEAAGQVAVENMAEAILSAGLDFMVVSTGALIDDALRSRLIVAGEGAGSRLLVPAGAIAGLDGLGAMKLSGSLRVRYTSIKPPIAWFGTPAETLIDLSAVSTPTTFFTGTARDAAKLFPKNANLAATIALAGAGLDHTMIDLVADPNSSGNCGCIDATARGGHLHVILAGPSMPGNPKTSVITAYSVLSALTGRSQTIAF